MNPDAFEKRASTMRPRPVPAAWRGEILAAARAAGSARGRREADRSGHLWAGLRGWLWPAPWAWSGLAGAWVLIVALNRAAAIGESPVTSVVPWSYLALQGPPATTVREPGPAEPARRPGLPGTGWRQRPPAAPGACGPRSVMA